jgi:peroxiredoxin
MPDYWTNFMTMIQKLKSLFIIIYPILGMIGVAISIDLYIHENQYAAIGLAMISLPILFFLGMLYLTNVARTDPHLTFYSIIVGLGLLILTVSFYTGRAEPMASLGFLLPICWLMYVRWYSTFGDRTNSLLKAGQSLPSMKFEDENGKLISDESLLGKKNILMFYRGNWCPLCMAQIKDLAKEFNQLQSMGIQTVLISPQPRGKTKKLAQRHDVDFKFLVDKDNKVAKQLNILSENGLPTGFQVMGYDSDTVLPTIILTNEKGIIIHSDLTSNYRVRPEPMELIKYFE